MPTLRNCLFAMLVGVLGACGGAPATPSGQTPAGSAAPNGSTGASNPAFEAFRSGIPALASQSVGNLEARRDSLITVMGLRTSLGTEADLILAVVAAAEDAARAKTTVTSLAPQGTIVYAVAILPARPGGLAQPEGLAPPVPPPNNDLRESLPDAVGNVGRPGDGSRTLGPKSESATATDGGMTGTTQMTTTTSVSIAGSIVTVEVKRDVHSVVTDSTGATVYDGTRKYKITAQINACPSSAGISEASVSNAVDEDANTFPGGGGRVGSHATANLTSTSTFQGQVDDKANLGSVSQDYSHHETFRRTAQAAGGPEAAHEGAFGVEAKGIKAGVPAERDWSLIIGDYSDASGTAELSGDATQNMLTSTAFSAADDFTTMDLAFLAAQKIWRHGGCVMVTVPAYNAETALGATGENFIAHTEEVDKGSTTEFEANLKHRFGGGVIASIEAVLSNGKEKLTPGSIAQPPGTLTYLAPDEDGKDASVTMTATSKQGIGRLVLGFHTGGKKLQVSIIGKMTTSLAGISYVTSLSAPKIVLSKQADGNYVGSGPVTATISFDIEGCPQPYKQTGTMKLRATRQVVEEQSLSRRWLVTWDSATDFSTTGTCMGVGMESFTGTGDETGITAGFMLVLGKIEFLQDGSTEHIKRSLAIGPAQNTIDAVVKGEILVDSGP